MGHAGNLARKKRRKRKSKCSPSRKHRTKVSESGQDPLEAYDARRRKKKKVVCKRRKRRTTRWVSRAPAPVIAAPPPPSPPPTRQVAGAPTSPISVYTGTFGAREAERLLWRAGFGPSPGWISALSSMGLGAAVQSLTRPTGEPVMTGAAPTLPNGLALAPEDAFGHDHLFWLDRMVRTSQPFVERMALIWHDWFATSNAGVASQKLMLGQYELFRAFGRGTFMELVGRVTQDPAMIVWLNQNQNRVGRINENYARELMELFTLGADRGAYTESDVRELARALSGWTNSYTAEQGNYDFRYDPARHDGAVKTVFGSTGYFGWEDAYRMCVQHPMHASFFVPKLWSYFVPTPMPADDRQKLEAFYVSSGFQIRPCVEAILMHPDLHRGPRMIKPPVVLAAGMLRAIQRGIDTTEWTSVCEQAGQRLFYPPDVSGWDDTRWLDTSTTRGRWLMVRRALSGRNIETASAQLAYSDTETPAAAVAAALAFWGDPPVTTEADASLSGFAATCLPAVMTPGEQHTLRAMRQNALRQLVYSSPDLQAG